MPSKHTKALAKAAKAAAKREAIAAAATAPATATEEPEGTATETAIAADTDEGEKLSFEDLKAEIEVYHREISETFAAMTASDPDFADAIEHSSLCQNAHNHEAFPRRLRPQRNLCLNWNIPAVSIRPRTREDPAICILQTFHQLMLSRLRQTKVAEEVDEICQAWGAVVDMVDGYYRRKLAGEIAAAVSEGVCCGGTEDNGEDDGSWKRELKLRRSSWHEMLWVPAKASYGSGELALC
ncbi:hypothetical protein EDC01DRAFT_783439 [Geopyxis carbonaria]|nr:hypothetical protein EDC01DRAFT_783439 [Geopyxis carbonaria]